jgi:hypothetical protein
MPRYNSTGSSLMDFFNLIILLWLLDCLCQEDRHDRPDECVGTGAGGGVELLGVYSCQTCKPTYVIHIKQIRYRRQGGNSAQLEAMTIKSIMAWSSRSRRYR